MPVITALVMPTGRKKAGMIAALVIALGLLFGIFVSRGAAGGLADQVRRGLMPLQTLAAMIADRSPGDRPEGALASLKHKRQAVLSDHVPGPASASPLAALLTAPPEFIPPTVAGPLFGPLGTPAVVVPPVEAAAIIPPIGGGFGPGVIVPAAAGGGGGGGGGGTTPVTPTTPTTTTPTVETPAVPEPSSWAMMLVGFGLIGAALRRHRAPGGSFART